MNVLSLTSYHFLPANMGGQKNIALHNAFLSKHVNLICVATVSNDVNEAPYKVLNILKESRFRYVNIFLFFRLRKIIKEENISHLILEHPYFGWLGFLLKHFCQVKLIIHSHNIESIRFKTIQKWWWKILWFYERWVYQQADCCLLITKEDRIYAEKFYKINKDKSAVITYGIEIDKIPSTQEKQEAKAFISSKYKISEQEKIILFNGTLSYGPNITAIETILHHINPILQQNQHFTYKILICGKGLPEKFNHLTNEPNIIYCGLVDDISIYFKAADIFINPVVDGGGIKTKIVEALAYNTTVISTQSGAIGIPEIITNDKLLMINDNDWLSFSNLIIKTDTTVQTPDSFYQHFYWGNIAEKTYQILQQIQ
jgi:polysaccharide biosynthesis protein PslH